MNRIELYVDRENKLTLDFYYNINDDYPISLAMSISTPTISPPS